MDTHALCPYGSDLKAISWKLPGLGRSNMNFMIADAIQFPSGTMTIFSNGDRTKIKFQSLAARL